MPNPKSIEQARELFSARDMPKNSYWTYNNWEDIREKFILEFAKAFDSTREETASELQALREEVERLKDRISYFEDRRGCC